MFVAWPISSECSKIAAVWQEHVTERDEKKAALSKSTEKERRFDLSCRLSFEADERPVAVSSLELARE